MTVLDETCKIETCFHPLGGKFKTSNEKEYLGHHDYKTEVEVL